MHLCLQRLPCPSLASFPTCSVTIQTLNVCPDLVRNRSESDKIHMTGHMAEELGGPYQALGAELEFGGLEMKQCFLLEMASPYILG